MEVTPVERLLTTVMRSGQLLDLTIQDPPLDEIVLAIYAEASEKPVRDEAPVRSREPALEVVS